MKARNWTALRFLVVSTLEWNLKMVTGPLGPEIDREARRMYNGQPAGQSQGCAARLWPLRHRAASQNAPRKNF